MPVPDRGVIKVRFESFELDAVSATIRKAGTALKLQPQPFRVLLLLATKSEQVVTREEIRKSVWGDATFVDFERGINFAVNQIRGALNDEAEKPRYIETLPRIGYRFLVPVTVENGRVSPAAAGTEPGVNKDADEVRADVATFKRDIAPKHRIRTWILTAGGVAALLIASATFWLARRQTSPVPELKLRRLTANSIGNAVRTGMISPDGKYLAYADTKHLYIKLIGTGETQTIAQPDALRDGATWEIAAWFPDSTRFVSNAHPPGSDPDQFNSQGTSVWVAPVLGGAPLKLRDDARAYSVSPDASVIAFATHKGKFGDREIWLMEPTGEQARKLYDTDENSWLGAALWSPDGKRILYARIESDRISLLTLDPQGGSPATVQMPSEAQDFRYFYDFFWLPDGRLIYSLAEPEALSRNCNFWEMRFDPQTGKTTEKPRRLTNWSDHCMSGMSVTADGRRLAFLKWTGHFTAYVADLKSGSSRITTPYHLTPTESADVPVDWTANGKTILLLSNRNGHLGIYMQPLSGDTAESLVTGPYNVQDARVSPDGHWVIYQVPAKSGDSSAPVQIMRVPISGGVPQEIFTAQPNSSILCARYASNLCAIAEPTEDNKQIIFMAFDPLKGRGSELTRLDLDPSTNLWAVDLSSDGTRIAAIRSPAGPIELLSLRGAPRQEIRVKGWSNLQSVRWAADGKGLFVGNSVQGGAVLLHVSLNGNASVLWETRGGRLIPVRPSPDGRHLAIPSWTEDCNVWMLENF